MPFNVNFSSTFAKSVTLVKRQFDKRFVAFATAIAPSFENSNCAQCRLDKIGVRTNDSHQSQAVASGNQ